MKLHIDIDCFFVSAHRINNPQYEYIPLAVGGRSNLSIFEVKKSTRTMSQVDGAFTSSILSSNDDKTFEDYYVDPDKRIRGIITTSSYEARGFGVKTTMTVSEALRWCPNLIVLPPNYPLYHDLSHKFKLLLEKEIPSIEQFSIDEFFGDVGLLECALVQRAIDAINGIDITHPTRQYSETIRKDKKPGRNERVMLQGPAGEMEFVKSKKVDSYLQTGWNLI